MMELKVWVDGIPRVVSGATYDTTCQDVVIALAYAMDRTGRFTLTEKWRNISRPLTPDDYPLQVLHKWGEYAPEVQFVLCQANTEDDKQTANKDKLMRKRGEQHVFSHHLMQRLGSDAAGNASVKRSLTFSGAHNHLPQMSVMTPSAPVSKFRKTQKGPVPNGDAQELSGSACASHPSPQPLPKQPRKVGGPQQVPQPRTVQQPPHPVPPPRHRITSQSQQVRENVLSSASTPTSSASPSDSSNSNKNTVSSPRPLPAARSHPVTPVSASSSHPQSTPPHVPQLKSESRISPAPPQPESQIQTAKPRQEPKSPVHLQTQHTTPLPVTPPPLPSSPPPPLVLGVHPERKSGPGPEGGSELEEVSMGSPDHSRRASLEIEEYDLEHNFPDPHREYSHTERPSVSLEYRLDDGMGVGCEGQPVDGEHTKLLRLVNSLEDHLKTQESQIGLINTEITALEEKEKEYEEKLHVIMEELLLHENRQRELEVQLNDLEKVEWSNVLDGEKKCEIDLTLEIASMKASILDHEEKLTEARTKEDQLLNELKEEEEKINQERERLKAEEAKVKEEEEKTKEEISKLQAVLTEEEKKSTDYEASLSTVETELTTVEKELTEKQAAVTEGEAKLKDENFKDFVTHPVLKEDPKSAKSGEAVLKLLEGRMSPHPPANASSKPGDSPRPAAFIATLTASSQNSVWV